MSTKGIPEIILRWILLGVQLRYFSSLSFRFVFLSADIIHFNPSACQLFHCLPIRSAYICLDRLLRAEMSCKSPLSVMSQSAPQKDTIASLKHLHTVVESAQKGIDAMKKQLPHSKWVRLDLI